MFFLRYILVDGEVLDTKGKTDVFKRRIVVEVFSQKNRLRSCRTLLNTKFAECSLSEAVLVAHERILLHNRLSFAAITRCLHNACTIYKM